MTTDIDPPPGDYYTDDDYLPTSSPILKPVTLSWHDVTVNGAGSKRRRSPEDSDASDDESIDGFELDLVRRITTLSFSTSSAARSQGGYLPTCTYLRYPPARRADSPSNIG